MAKTVKTIGTHSGTFHCDEALGCFLLRRTKLFANAKVTRTRDEQVLQNLDCVIDVGGVYDHGKHRYDHHQRGFSEFFGHDAYHNTKLSSAGLVYRHYGKEVIARETGLDEEHPDTNVLFLAMYKHFIEGVDAIDNGVEQYRAKVEAKQSKRQRTGGEGEREGEGEGEQEEEEDVDYEVTLEKVYLEGTGLASRVGALNAAWNEDASAEVQDARFKEASEMAGKEFLSKLTYLHRSWLPAREIVKQAMISRYDVDDSGKIMKLDRYCPWKDHLFELEMEEWRDHPEGDMPRVLYCLYEDDREKKWRIMSVPELGGSAFSQRKPLPGHWCGLRDIALDAVTGVPGCTFVHAAGFTGGHSTYEGIVKLAQMAITDTCCCCQ
ncbi:metal-dependent protein hydrolase [Chloropicon primus]|uniref:Metal-dependent protein hydrolase n=2 Tax=Chloropicon primus TaxID=1764295 RepID=A0A5B8MWH1_9CHLO|nr:metal-dependent protein hydrolase [Chloropicon primus]UPR03195.1 metal-dependent protein hydrolase [Chloropicon primus]|eukprot:QDZ23984.1 metal-dependent protein hydrolase [Chloropicon primus]